SPKEGTVDPQTRHHLVIAQQPQSAKGAQETAGFPRERREERDYHYDVRPGRESCKVLQRVTTDDQARGKIRKYQDSEGYIERLDGLVSRQKRRCDDKDDRNDIENKQGVAEPYGGRRFPFIEVADLALQLIKQD